MSSKHNNIPKKKKNMRVVTKSEKEKAAFELQQRLNSALPAAPDVRRKNLTSDDSFITAQNVADAQKEFEGNVQSVLVIPHNDAENKRTVISKITDHSTTIISHSSNNNSKNQRPRSRSRSRSRSRPRKPHRRSPPRSIDRNLKPTRGGFRGIRGIRGRAPRPLSYHDYHPPRSLSPHRQSNNNNNNSDVMREIQSIREESKRRELELKREYDLKLERMRSQVESEIRNSNQEMRYMIRLDQKEEKKEIKDILALINDQKKQIDEASATASKALHETNNTTQLINNVRAQLESVTHLVKCEAKLYQASADQFETGFVETMHKLSSYVGGTPHIDAVVLQWQSSYDAVVLVAQKIVNYLQLPLFVMCKSMPESTPVQLPRVEDVNTHTEYHILTDVSHDDCEKPHCPCRGSCPCGGCATDLQNDVMKECPLHLFVAALTRADDKKHGKPSLLVLVHGIGAFEKERENSRFEIIPIILDRLDVPSSDDYRTHWSHIKKPKHIKGKPHGYTGDLVPLKFTSSWIVDEQRTAEVFPNQ